MADKSKMKCNVVAKATEQEKENGKPVKVEKKS